MKINILTSRFPYPLEKGDKLRIYHQIRLLSQHHDLYLFAIDNGQTSSTDLLELSQYCKEVKIYQIPVWKRFWTTLTGVFNGLPIHVAYFFDRNLKKEIQQDLITTNADLTFCQLIRVAPYLKNYPGKVWIDFMDSFSGNLTRRAFKAPWWEKIWLGWEIKRIKKIEQKSLIDFDAFSIISEQDRIEIDPHNKHHIAILPNGVDTTYFQENEYSNTEYDLCFTGNLGYEPNIKAAKILIKDIGDRMEEDISIRIAGARPDNSLLRLSNSRYLVTGWVDDIRDIYWSGKIFVAPLFSGSGQQNKILEAMACGVPVITTSLVNNAIGAQVGSEIIVADDIRSFIVQIDQLLNDEDLQNKLSENARDFVENKYDWSQIGKQIEAFLKN